jgi:hypothetical protein
VLVNQGKEKGLADNGRVIDQREVCKGVMRSDCELATDAVILLSN